MSRLNTASPFYINEVLKRPGLTEVRVVNDYNSLPGTEDLAGTVIDVANKGRRDPSLWRAARLAIVVDNCPLLDAVTAPGGETHFFRGPGARMDALEIGRSIAGGGKGFDATQPPPLESPISSSAAIVFGLDPERADEFPFRPSDRGACLGVIVDGELPLDAVDEQSRRVIEHILSKVF